MSRHLLSFENAKMCRTHQMNCKNIRALFCHSRLYLGIEAVFCHLLQWMERMNSKPFQVLTNLAKITKKCLAINE